MSDTAERLIDEVVGTDEAKTDLSQFNPVMNSILNLKLKDSEAKKLLATAVKALNKVGERLEVAEHE